MRINIIQILSAHEENGGQLSLGKIQLGLTIHLSPQVKSIKGVYNFNTVLNDDVKKTSQTMSLQLQNSKSYVVLCICYEDDRPNCRQHDLIRDKVKLHQKSPFLSRIQCLLLHVSASHTAM